MEREVPDSIYFDCPVCDDSTEHTVLKGRVGKSTFEATLKCTECGRTFSTTIPIPKVIKLKVIISDGPHSETSFTEMEEDDVLYIDDEFFIEDGRRLRVCAIELDGDKRVKKSKVDKIKVLWAQQFDNLTIKVTINDNKVSHPRKISAKPDDVFQVFQDLVLDDMNCIITTIKTKDKVLQRYGSEAEARDIVRIYGRYSEKDYDVLDFDD